MTAPIANPGPSFADRLVVLTDPRPGTVVALAAGSHLAVRFRRPLGASRWQVVERPRHLLSLRSPEPGDHEFQFLVFGGATAPSPVRFERRHTGRDVAHDVCEVLVVPVSEPTDDPTAAPVGGTRPRTSRSAAPRSS